MGFSGSVNGTTKNPGFWILVFANVNGPYVRVCYTTVLSLVIDALQSKYIVS